MSADEKWKYNEHGFSFLKYMKRTWSNDFMKDSTKQWIHAWGKSSGAMKIIFKTSYSW